MWPFTARAAPPPGDDASELRGLLASGKEVVAPRSGDAKAKVRVCVCVLGARARVVEKSNSPQPTHTHTAADHRHALHIVRVGGGGRAAVSGVGGEGL